MGFISRLIGTEELRDEIKVQINEMLHGREAGNIAYEAGLVEKLKDDHQVLLHLHTAIKNAAQEGRYMLLPTLLANLRSALQAHIMVENVKFYLYLQQHCAQDIETAIFVSEVRKEMDDIAHAVVMFVKRYSSYRLAEENLGNFNIELELLGSVLLQRIHLEEDRLYTLYQPKYN